MNKSQLLGIVCALTFFAMISGANAAIIASDDISITSTDQPHVQTLAASPSSIPGTALTLNVLGESGQMQPDKYFNYYEDSTSSESPHTDSHISLWLLLIMVFVFSILSETFHRRYFNR